MVASDAATFYCLPFSMKYFLLVPIYFYRWVLRPALSFIVGPVNWCRYQPSCSVYAIQAISEHGAWRGGFLGFKRVCRCHPWGGWGYDPVPPRRLICKPSERSI